MSGHFTVSLSGFDDWEASIVRQAIENNMNKITINDDLKSGDLQITPQLLPPAPYKMGAILDRIETYLFEHKFPKTISYKNYTLGWAESSLNIGDKHYILTDRERDLMMEFITAGDKGCNRDYLLKTIWGYRADLETHALETQIYRLRQKIETEPDNPQYLVTIDNGYRLN